MLEIIDGEDVAGIEEYRSMQWQVRDFLCDRTGFNLEPPAKRVKGSPVAARHHFTSLNLERGEACRRPARALRIVALIADASTIGTAGNRVKSGESGRLFP